MDCEDEDVSAEAASDILVADSDEDDDNDIQAGWQIAADAIKLALNNRVDDAHVLLSHSKASCVHKQAGYCYLTFIVSRSSYYVGL